MKELRNFGTYVLNPTQEKKSPKTVIVMGVARSGTSMVAKVLEEMGVFIGAKRDAAVFEDVEIANLLEKDFDEQKLKTLIEERNKRHAIWGFKRPAALSYIHKYENYFSNVHYVIPFRDLLAISLRNVISMNSEILASIAMTANFYEELIQFLKNTKQPSFIFSYEKSLVKKQKFVSALAEFLDIQMKPNQVKKIAAAIEVDNISYLKSSRIKTEEEIAAEIIGGVGNLTQKGVLKGWVKYRHNDESVALRVKVNNQPPLQTTANVFRQDLVKQNVGNGKHGFSIDLSKHLVKNRLNTIRVVVQKTGEPLNRSPKKVYWGNRYFFIHIPKTAGTTFRHILYETMGEQNTYPLLEMIKETGQYPDWRTLFNLKDDVLNERHLLVGHYPFGLNHVWGENVQKMVFLREPVERTLSHLNHIKSYSKQHTDASLEEIFNKHQTVLSNTQTRFLFKSRIAKSDNLNAPDRLHEKHLEMAKKNLAQCVFVGITERFDESMKLFAQYIGNEMTSSFKEMNKAKAKYSVSDDLAAKVKEANLLDIQLYQYAMELFEERISTIL